MTVRRRNGCQNLQSLEGHIHPGHPGRDLGLPCDHAHERQGEEGVIAHALGAGAEVGRGAGLQETEVPAEASAEVGVGAGEEAEVGVVVGVLSRVPR